MIESLEYMVEEGLTGSAEALEPWFTTRAGISPGGFESESSWCRGWALPFIAAWKGTGSFKNAF